MKQIIVLAQGTTYAIDVDDFNIDEQGNLWLYDYGETVWVFASGQWTGIQIVKEAEDE